MMKTTAVQQKAAALSRQFRALAQDFRNVDPTGGFQRVVDLAAYGGKLCKKAYAAGLLDISRYKREVALLTELASNPQDDLPSLIRNLLLEEYGKVPDQPIDALNAILDRRLDEAKLWPGMDSADMWAGTWRAIVSNLCTDHPDQLPCKPLVDNPYLAYFGGQERRTAKTEWRSLAQNYAMVADWLVENLQAGGMTDEGEGKDEAGRTATPRQPRKRKRRPDPKTVKKREERDKWHKMEEAIADEWKKGQWTDYEDYVRWQNEHLPDGWPELDRRAVARAVENVNRRARYRKK